MEKIVDVAIIGAGTSGLNALGQIKKAGKSFVLINGGHWGTTCARVGCMPSKAMIQVAEDFHRKKVFARHGIYDAEDLYLDQEDSMEHVRDMRDTFVDRVLESSTDNMPDDVKLDGYARFVEPGVLQVGDVTVKASRVIIATGTTPIVPAIWKVFGDKILTTDEVFEQESFPATMAVIGLGVIGLEIGQALSRKGVSVTGIEGSNTIASLSDPVARDVAIATLAREFYICLGHRAELSEEGDKIKVTAGEHSILVDRVVVSIGRTPNLNNLGLDKLDLPLDAKGMPAYDENSMQIGDLAIYIAGDSNASRQILHEASDEGKIAGYNAAHNTSTKFKRKTPLSITFCDPNISIIGQTWAELEGDVNVVVGEMSLGPIGRALIMASNRGVMRIYAHKLTGKVLGAAIVSTRGEHIAHLLAWGISQNMSVHDMLQMPYYHPVIEEAMQACLYHVKSKLEIADNNKIYELEELSDD